MLRYKPIILTFFVCALAFTGSAQSERHEKSNAMADFFGFDGLRLNNPDILYNEQFLKDSTYFYTKESQNDEFLSFSKVLFDYDNQGRLLVEHEFEKKESVWQESIERVFNYDEDGFVQYTVSKEWNSTIGVFDNKRRTFYYRNFLGLVSQEIVERNDGDKWKPDFKHDFIYNRNNDLTEELSFEWIQGSMEWEPTRKIIYEYNENEELSSEVFQVWVDTLGSWVNQYFRGYSYNEENQLVNLFQSAWNRNVEEWVEESVQSLSYTPLGQIENSDSYDASNLEGEAKQNVKVTYDEEGNPNTTLFREWDNELNNWNSYEKHVHFWSQYLIGNLDVSDDNIECFYINPHTVGLPWHCDELLENEVYLLSVYDQNGILHHSQQFRGRDTFRLTKHLNNGLYLVVITGGLTAHTEKVLIKN